MFEETLVKIFGIGNKGVRITEYVFKKGITNTDFIGVNVDSKTLFKLNIPIEFQPTEKAAKNFVDKIREILTDSVMAFLILDGRNSDDIESARLIAEIAKENKVITVGIFICPSDFKKFSKFKELVDTVIIVQQESLHIDVDYEFIYQVIIGITELFTRPGLICVDLADVRTAMSNSGFALIDIGKASGENKALRAAKEAINSLGDFQIRKAKYILLTIRGGEDLTLDEGYKIAGLIKETAKKNDTNYFFVVMVSEELKNSIEVIIVATGIKELQHFG